MTTTVDIVNRALQTFGARTTVDAADLAAESSNESIQANICLTKTRDELLRMAPWDCGMKFANLNLIYAAPGTPENPSQASALWAPGQPPPPWAYEYQYPNDCLRACWIIPQFQSGFSGGIPITTAVTGGAASHWRGPPVKFKVATDQFYPCTTSGIAAGGTGFSIGDIVILPSSADSANLIGAGAHLLVTAVAAGVITTAVPISQVDGTTLPSGGSYYGWQATTAQDSVLARSGGAGVGTGASFVLLFGAKSSQRVILTNQESATLAYVHQISDPNVMDPLFQDAWVEALGANLCLALTGDKGLANMGLQRANNIVVEARKANGNEGLTINDVTPDWIRVRGIGYSDYSYSPNINFDWGSLFTPF